MRAPLLLAFVALAASSQAQATAGPPLSAVTLVDRPSSENAALRSELASLVGRLPLAAVATASRSCQSASLTLGL